VCPLQHSAIRAIFTTFAIFAYFHTSTFAISAIFVAIFLITIFAIFVNALSCGGGH
jgi:hypothetical protein